MNSKRKQGGETKTHNNRTVNAAGSRKGALISAAAAIGLLTSQGGDFYDGPALYVQALKMDQRMRMHERDVVGSDDIGKSSADDMFAFSQIVASGGNPMEVAAQLEKEAAAKKQEDKKIGGLSEDQAMAAFAEFVSGEGTDQVTVDPRKVQAEKEAAAKAAAARSELKELATNEATSAFASLVDSQVIQEKAATYEGSGTEAEAEAAIAKGQATSTKQPGDALLAVQKRSEAELSEANKQVETTDCAQEAAAQLGAAGNVLTGEENATPPAEGAPAEAAAAKPGKAAAPNKAADAKKQKAKPAAKPKAAPAKKAPAAAKAKPAPKAPAAAPAAPAAPEPERPSVDLAASLAASASKEDQQVDSQADEILDQIRSAAVGIKGLGGGGEAVDEGALQAAMKGMNLLQLEADVRDHDLPDDNAQLAMDYLAQQFPDEYPRDTVKPTPPKGPSPEEKEAADKQALLAYAQRVTEEATASRDQVVNAIAEKEERSKLARMGMEGEPVTLQLSAENLVQLGASLHFDADALTAQSYLESQFPEEFPQDPVPEKPATGPPPEEAQKQEEKEFLRYAEKVTEAATESRDRVVQEINDKKEKEELSKMGLGKPAKPVDWKAVEAKRRDTVLAQLGSTTQTGNTKVAVPRDVQLVQLSEDVVIDEQESGQESEAQTPSGANHQSQVTLAQVSQRSREKLVSESEAGEGLAAEESLEEGAELEAMPQPAVVNTPQNDLSGMSADDMRSYSESVAQAADVVNSESEMDKAKEADAKNKGQAAQVKADKQAPQVAAAKSAGQPVSKDEQQLIDQESKGLEMKNPDLEAKAALVAQAESANQAAIEDAGQPAGLAKAGPQAKNVKEASLEELDADQKKEQLRQFETAKYAQDKKAALDQGYTDEQAELFAKQEAYANSMKPNPEQLAPTMQTPDPSQPGGATPSDPQLDTQSAKNIPKPVSGPTGSPPTIIGRDQAGSTKEAAAPADSAADLQAAALAAPSAAQTAEEASIEQQIKQAQEQQAMIKAQLEKRKQEKQNLLAMNQISGVSDAPAQAPATVAKPAPVAAPDQQQQAAEVQALTQPQPPADVPPQQPAAVPSPPAPEQPEADSPQRQAQALAEQMGLKVPAADAAQPQMDAQTNSVPIQATSQQQQAEVKPQEVSSQAAQAPLSEELPIKQEAKVAAPVQAAPAEQPAADDQKMQEKTVQAPPAKKEQTKTHKLEKSTLQQSEEIHRHTPKEIKKQLKQLNKGQTRAQQYEEDLNKARDEIQKAQVEMKNIDSEVADFHQKMAKSMHSLLKAFTEGFEAMDKAKTDELDNELEQRAAEKKRASKFDKLNLGISNLQALTSKLKMSFGDEGKDQQPAQEEAVQASSDIHQASAVAKADAQRDQTPVDQSQANPKVKQEPQQKLTAAGQREQAKQPAAAGQPKPLAPAQAQQKPAQPRQQPTAKTAAKPNAQAPRKPQPQTVNVQSKAPAKTVAPAPQKRAQPQTAQNAQAKQAVKPHPAQTQQKQVAKPQMKQQAAHQMAQVKKVAVKPQQPAAHPVKTVKVQQKPQNVKQVGPAKAAPAKTANSAATKQKLVQSKSQTVKKVLPMQKQSAVAGAKNVVVKPIKLNGVATTQSKMQAVKPIVKNKVQKLVQTKKMPAKTGVKMIQLKKKPVGGPVKLIAKKQQAIVHKPALGLAQLTESTAGLNTDNLVQTDLQVTQKQQAYAESQSLEENDDQDREVGSSKMIAHTIADRVLMQLEQGKSEDEIMADLGKTKQALNLAKKAYYQKDPEAIELLQLSDETGTVQTN